MSVCLQKEHEESVAFLKQQVEVERKRRASVAVSDDIAPLQAQLAQVMAEVSSLQQQLKEAENSLRAKTAELDAGVKSAGAAAGAAGDSAQSTQNVREERDRAVADLTSRTQAWNAEKEQLKNQLEHMKADFNAKLAAAAKVTPGNPADEALALKAQSLDSLLRECIKKGELRGAAVNEVGKVCLGPRRFAACI
jgi:predicted RNase H-like nuclease (RuvC/YqgF family)